MNRNLETILLLVVVSMVLIFTASCKTNSEKTCNSIYIPNEPQNIIENSSFEQSTDTSAAFWGKYPREIKILNAYNYDNEYDTSASFWAEDPGQMVGQYEYYVADKAHSGRKSLAIKGIKAGKARWYTEDVYLVEGIEYQFSCWVRTEGTGVVARIWLPGADLDLSFGETPAWLCLERSFVATFTGQTTLYLLSYGLETVFFDDVSIKMTTMPLKNTKSVIPTNGKPLTQIVIPDNPSVSDHYAALEVQRILKQMTGLELSIIPQPCSLSESGNIYINFAPDISRYSDDLAKIGDEGIILDITSDNIICLGNTPRGVYYAVQELFYILGCRWYTPWDGGECIPNTSTLNLRHKKIVHEPSFKMRGSSNAWTYHYPPDMTLSTISSHRGGFIDWAARNRMNNLRGHYSPPGDYGAIRGHNAQDFSGHTIYRMVDPSIYFADHPEYYCEINYPEGTVKRTHITPWVGQRPANVCVSNLDVIQLCADFVIDYFDTHPYAERVHIGQNDCAAHCECASCKALDPPGSVDWENKDKGAILVLTDRWMWFINQIADIVKLSYPTKYVGTYAYAETHTLPIDSNNNPNDNVMIEFCWAETNFQGPWRNLRCYKHNMNDPNCDRNVEGIKILNDWFTLAPVSIYSYYLFYSNVGTACSYCYHDASFYRALHNAGVRHVNDEIGNDHVSSPLLLNLRARLLWDINTDVDKYIDDFCNSVYGVAAIPVKQFFTTLEESVSESAKTHVQFNDFDILTPAILAELNGYLDSAGALAAGNTTLLARIARLRIAMIYTEIKTLTDPVAIDALQAQANTLVQTYDIPIRVGVWDVLAP